MDKKSKIALYIIVFVILMMMVAEITKPKAIIWRDSYSAADKIPLGCYVLFNELKNNDSSDFQVSNLSAFDYLRKSDLQDKASMFFINNYINFGQQDSESLLKFVEEGNSVLISSMYVSGLLADTLNLDIQRNYDFFKIPTVHKFSSPYLKNYKQDFDDVIENAYLKSFDTINTTVLGTFSDKEESLMHTNFVKIEFGENEGAFYIHSNPFAFSNYHMLDGKQDYAATVLSFLPDHLIIWDNYYKSGRKIIRSPLRFVLSNPSLKWAFYIGMLSILVYVIVNGKRTQRIIPVRTPLKNETIAFTQTIGDLYYQNSDYKDLIEKKIKYFLDYLRTKFYMETQDLNVSFIKKLSLKINQPYNETKTLVDFIIYLKSKNNHSETDLKKLNTMIENFKKTVS